MSTAEISYQSTFSAQAQSKLAYYCKTGKYDSIEGVRQEHVHHYRRLVFNVVRDSLETAYPLTHTLLLEEEWDDMVYTFWAEYPCSDSQVWKMPRDLWDFVKTSHLYKLEKKYPFILDLLWFEWIEIECYMMQDIKALAHQPYDDEKSDLEIERPLVINPEMRIDEFSYPVYAKKAPLITPEDKGIFYLCTFREQGGDRDVQFTYISAVFVHFLSMLQRHPLSTNDGLETLCRELGITANPKVRDSMYAFVKDAFYSGLLLGYVIP